MRIFGTLLVFVLFLGSFKAQNTKFNVFFLNKEVQLNNQIKQDLDNVVNILNVQKQLIVDIKPLGEYSLSSDIQIQRANNIASYLNEKGVDLYRIMTKLIIVPEQDNVLQILVNETSSELVANNQSVDNKSENKTTKHQNNSTLNTGDVVISNIFFGFDKDNTPEYYDNLDKLANYLNNNDDAKIEIQGYSDLQGDASYNLDLSYRRADFAKKYLVSKGCVSENIIVKTLGEKKQISTDVSPESRKYNRRVEFVVLNQGKNKLIVEEIVVPSQYKL